MTPDLLALLDAAADAFSLGTVREHRPVAGGLSNDVFRVVADRGAYAIKVLRTNADAADFVQRVETAFEIERAAYDDGVPCPEPVPVPGGGCLAQVAGRLVRAHHWVDGRSPDPSRSLDEAARLLARIHAVGQPYQAALDDEPWDAEGWASLATTQGLPDDLSLLLRSAAPRLAELEALTSAQGRPATTVPSHGDLDPKNTLRSQGRLLAVDWDAARPCSTAREAVGLGIDWVGTPDGVRLALDAYTDAGGGPVPDEPWVLGGWVSAVGGWLVHNVTRCSATDPGRHEIVQSTARLLAVHDDLASYVGALS